MSIANQITALAADKTAIETAITAKGGTLSQNSGFDTFAADIASIPSGSGNVEYAGNSASFSYTTISPKLQKFTYKETHPTRLTINFTGANIADDIYVTFANMPQTYMLNITSLAFRQCAAKKIGFGVSLGSVNVSLSGLFYNCQSLEEIYGTPLDFSAISNANDMPSFYCPKLKTVSFAKNTLLYTTRFGSCSELQNSSLISIANGLSESATGQSLTLHATPKANLSTIIGTVSLDETQTYHIFTQDDNGDTTLTDFITETKGWSIA